MEVEEGKLGLCQLGSLTKRWLVENDCEERAIEEAVRGSLKKLAQAVSLYEEQGVVDWALKALKDADPDGYRAATLGPTPAEGDNEVVDRKRGEAPNGS